MNAHVVAPPFLRTFEWSVRPTRLPNGDADKSAS